MRKRELATKILTMVYGDGNASLHYHFNPLASPRSFQLGWLTIYTNNPERAATWCAF